MIFVLIVHLYFIIFSDKKQQVQQSLIWRFVAFVMMCRLLKKLNQKGIYPAKTDE